MSLRHLSPALAILALLLTSAIGLSAATSTASRFNPDLPVSSTTIVSQANPNRDGTGPMGSFASGGATGQNVQGVSICAQAATTAGMIRLYVKPQSGPAALRAEIPVAAATPSGTVPAWSFEYRPAIPLYVGPGCTLQASTENAEPFALIAFIQQF